MAQSAVRHAEAQKWTLKVIPVLDWEWTIRDHDQLMSLYRFCDRDFRIDLIPEQNESSVETSSMRFVLGCGRLVMRQSVALHSHQYTATGDPLVSILGLSNGYLIRFPDVADFTVLDNDEIQCSPAPDVPEHTLEHLLYDHVIPRALSHKGRTVLHAAAVEVNGHAIAFLGDTGWGKSTLTASFWRAGYALVSDDCVVISNKEPITAAGIYPGMRLWPDSVLAVGVPADESTPMAHYSSKRRIVVDAEQDGVQTAPVPLQQVYLLASPDDDVTTISITETLPHERVIHYLEHAFRLDPTDRARNAAEFERLTQLAERLPMYRLQYPRRYDVLPDVRTAILAHVASTP